MFTDRFLKVPTDLVNERQKDLTGNDGAYEAVTSILPMEICEYHDTTYEEQTGTQIYFKNGRGFMINLSAVEFEKMLNDHQK